MIKVAVKIDEKQSGKNLWKSVEGYIKKAYDVPSIEKNIYPRGWR